MQKEDFYVCDCCELDDGRPVLYWQDCGGFSLCLECIGQLYQKFVLKRDKADEAIIVKRQFITEKLRNAIFERDGCKCVKCASQHDLTVDHIVAFTRGGSTLEENLQTLCRSCNSQKGAHAS